MPVRGQVVHSPPESPTTKFPPSKLERLEGVAPAPRTSSIDSAISSISSSTASHSHKHSESGSINHIDVSNLIQTAGSPESLIVHLLKEKQHAATQNAQLWTLLEKQRTLLLGLNKDLEQALKDRDRYRKKVRLLEGRPQTLMPSTDRAESESPAPSEVSDTGFRRQPTNTDSIDSTTQDAQTPPTTKPDLAVASSPIDSSLMPSPLHLLQLQQQKSSQTQDNVKQHTANHGTRPPAHPVQSMAREALPPPSRPPPSLPPLEKLPMPPPVNVIEPSPLTEKPEKLPQARRAPPAPLNLQHVRKASGQQQTSSPDEDSESDYDKVLEVDEIPAFDRGRRRTRAEDDQSREAALVKEQDARSKSKQKNLATGYDGAADESKTVRSPGLPSSPRQMVPQSPPNGAAGRLSPPAGLTSVLSSGSNEPSSISEVLISSPPLSPGLPISPRPTNRPIGSPQPRLPREGSGIVVSPPLSPDNTVSGSAPLSPRPPKQPIPLPPNTPQSLESPTTKTAPPPLSPVNTNIPRNTIPVITGADLEGSTPKSPTTPTSAHHFPQIYLGLVTKDHPDLLLPPNAIPSVEVQVASSRLRPSRSSYMAPKAHEEDPVFTLSVFARSDGRELWRVEKVILALPQLDQQIKLMSDFRTPLPDRKLFTGHSPAIIDTRRAALNSYFNELLDTQMDEKAAMVICHFLSTDVIEPRDDETSLLAVPRRKQTPLALGPDGRPRKEGYLTKRGKNFGGWKARFFVLQGPEFKYFESPGGPHLGNIKLRNAQIGKQAQSVSPARADDDIENQYRHAFLILEPKKKDSTSHVRHVLCAESDKERDEWVEALLKWVDYQDEDDQTKASSKRSEVGKPHITGFEAKVKQYGYVPHETSADSKKKTPLKVEVLQGVKYENTIAGEAPVQAQSPVERQNTDTPSPSTTGSSSTAAPMTSHQPSQEQGHSTGPAIKVISGPVNGGVIQDAGSWGNKAMYSSSAKEKEHREHKKRSIWGFRQRSTSDLIMQTNTHNESSSSLVQNHDSKQPARAVFGLPLAEAVEFCSPVGLDANLPAVVYRCIEYLRAKDAANEEGIFRQSGSNVVIRALRERFNTEIDVNLAAENHYYDVHAVASLFKQYLRELPNTVLTRELHFEFLRALDHREMNDKLMGFNKLVYKLPPVNLALLKILSEYLTEIVNNAHKNKMNLRNVGIVFSPTLNIPPTVFSMFLTNYHDIFNQKPYVGEIKTTEVAIKDPLTPEDIRSPRRQLLTNLPSPSHNQTSFATTSFPNPHAMQTKQETERENVSDPHNTGFVSMQPTYEVRSYDADMQSVPSHERAATQQNTQAEYGSVNRMLAPGGVSNVKAKRRESSMVFLGMGHRKSSVPRMREDPCKFVFGHSLIPSTDDSQTALVEEESAFE
ncbi:MAG: hypothetical protein Q9160_004264 [Pyrenula sp. 1 TL-2023]